MRRRAGRPRPRRALLATVALLASCTLDLNREGLRCEPAAGPGDRCFPVGVGECADGLSCDEGSCRAAGPDSFCASRFDCGVDSGLVCRFRRCADPSTLKAPGEVCRRGGECAPGTRCSFLDPQEPLRCLAVEDSGQGCSENLDCEAGDYCCLDGSCFDPAGGGTCLPRGARGDPCLASGDCRAGLVCTRELVCGEPPGLGERCLDRCARDLSCEPR